MNPKQLAALAAAALTVGAVALIADTKDVKNEKPADIKKEDVGTEKLAALDDGGLAYVRDVELLDGGRGQKIVTGPPGCVRRPSKSPVVTCRRRFSDGGVVDPGPLNRFPASEAQGPQCQPIACSVFLGEDPDAEEVERIKARPAKVKP